MYILNTCNLTFRTRKSLEENLSAKSTELEKAKEEKLKQLEEKEKELLKSKSDLQLVSKCYLTLFFTFLIKVIKFSFYLGCQ